MISIIKTRPINETLSLSLGTQKSKNGHMSRLIQTSTGFHSSERNVSFSKVVLHLITELLFTPELQTSFSTNIKDNTLSGIEETLVVSSLGLLPLARHICTAKIEDALVSYCLVQQLLNYLPVNVPDHLNYPFSWNRKSMTVLKTGNPMIETYMFFKLERGFSSMAHLNDLRQSNQ